MVYFSLFWKYQLHESSGTLPEWLLDFAIKNSIFANFQMVLQILKELSNDVSFVIFGHQTWDLEGGGQIDPPPAYPGFQVPQQG